MFTGLVEAVGRVLSLQRGLDGARMEVECQAFAAELTHGESVAVNGVCLTVVRADRSKMTVDVSAETLRRTSFSRLAAGHQVNLERALRAGDRMGGHIVNGHVDGTGSVLAITPESGFATWRFSLPGGLARYVVEKGSIAVDGVSLTVSALQDGGFEVALIPATLQATAFSGLRVGDPVNLEVDVLAKYVENMLGAQLNANNNLEHNTQSFEDALRRHGYL